MAKSEKRTATSARTIERLRRRLQEAEDTLDAIRDGHVEALVVRAPEGEQIYTLRSADQPYRLMVEQMREGALTLAADGTILYCNNRFAELDGARRPSASPAATCAEFVDCRRPPEAGARCSSRRRSATSSSCGPRSARRIRRRCRRRRCASTASARSPSSSPT